MAATFEENKKVMTELLLNDEFSRHLGIEILEFEEKYIRARIPFKKPLLNNYGSVHGGALYSFADILAGTVACMSGKFCTTVEGSMNYLEPAVSREYIYCEAKRVRGGNHLIVVKVKIKNDDGTLVDDGSFTFYRSPKDVSL
ncbi:MAG: PaaI family thioesterase [Lachnospiraceae bacterium]|nr:PaaI family thioesterase [Lachnospiraceae bacterium]